MMLPSMANNSKNYHNFQQDNNKNNNNDNKFLGSVKKCPSKKGCDQIEATEQCHLALKLWPECSDSETLLLRIKGAKVCFEIKKGCFGHEIILGG